MRWAVVGSWCHGLSAPESITCGGEGQIPHPDWHLLAVAQPGWLWRMEKVQGWNRDVPWGLLCATLLLVWGTWVWEDDPGSTEQHRCNLYSTGSGAAAETPPVVPVSCNHTCFQWFSQLVESMAPLRGWRDSRGQVLDDGVCNSRAGG